MSDILIILNATILALTVLVGLVVVKLNTEQRRTNMHIADLKIKDFNEKQQLRTAIENNTAILKIHNRMLMELTEDKAMSEQASKREYSPETKAKIKADAEAKIKAKQEKEKQ